ASMDHECSGGAPAGPPRPPANASSRKRPAAPTTKVKQVKKKPARTCRPTIDMLMTTILASITTIVTETMSIYDKGFAEPWDGTTPITVGSACSGWNSEILTLEAMKIPFHHAFSCDNSKHVKKIAEFLHGYHEYFDDVMGTNFLGSAVPVQFFMAGFPCQCWSVAGRRDGFLDARGLGLIIVFLIAYITTRRPLLFLLENVDNIAAGDNADSFNAIVSALQTLTDKDNRYLYTVESQTLNCRIHGGLPQNRRRRFIVGVLRGAQQAPLQWPGPVTMRNLIDLMDPATDLKPFPGNLPSKSSGTKRKNVLDALKAIASDGSDPLAVPAVVDHGSSKMNYAIGYSPCLTRNRAMSHGHWVTCLQREMTTGEMLRLQGVEEWRVRGWKHIICEGQFHAIIGNAIPLPMIERILMRALYSASLAKQPLHDKYED
ncbi:unnamed protein product, partial [Prorocentrum cordatum]